MSTDMNRTRVYTFRIIFKMRFQLFYMFKSYFWCNISSPNMDRDHNFIKKDRLFKRNVTGMLLAAFYLLGNNSKGITVFLNVFGLSCFNLGPRRRRCNPTQTTWVTTCKLHQSGQCIQLKGPYYWRIRSGSVTKLGVRFLKLPTKRASFVNKTKSCCRGLALQRKPCFVEVPWGLCVLHEKACIRSAFNHFNLTSRWCINTWEVRYKMRATWITSSKSNLVPDNQQVCDNKWWHVNKSP